jgi:hypothetical protein
MVHQLVADSVQGVVQLVVILSSSKPDHGMIFRLAERRKNLISFIPGPPFRFGFSTFRTSSGTGQSMAYRKECGKGFVRFLLVPVGGR